MAIKSALPISNHVFSKRDRQIILSDRLCQPDTKFVPAQDLDDAATHAGHALPMGNWSAAQKAEPHNPPATSRTTNFVERLGPGVFASLLAASSTIVSTLKTRGVPIFPRNASPVFTRCSHPRCAALLDTAGAARERSPAIMPIRKART